MWFDVIKLPEGLECVRGEGGDTSYKYTNFLTCVLDYFERSSLLFQLSTKIESLALLELKKKRNWLGMIATRVSFRIY